MGVSYNLRWIPGLVYQDLYLGGKALVERENVGFDLTKSDLCPSFVEDHIVKGVRLCVVNSNTGNHSKDDFTPLETIRSNSPSYLSAAIFWGCYIHPSVLFGPKVLPPSWSLKSLLLLSSKLQAVFIP
ncbi:hypothetical protein Tco_0445661 [Tanacetum coccineum]